MRPISSALEPMRRIPSLDGLRALSISLVIVQHLLMSEHVAPHNQRYAFFLWNLLGNGELGVAIFFVISGFLITFLLLNENNENGRICLKRFYIRRAFRIVPPFYTFLIVLLFLYHTGFLYRGPNGPTDPASFQEGWMAALVFLRDYFPGRDWWTAHTWSLGIEEQFYLLWPACLAMAGLGKSKKVVLALIAASPVIRIACRLLFPNLGWLGLKMFHMQMDGLMTGCALAMFYPYLQCKGRWTLPAAIFLFVVSPYLGAHFRGYYVLPLGVSLDNLAIAYLVLYAVRTPGSAFGRVLNHRVIIHIGVLSYSLYLWQELFFGKFHFPWSLLGALVAAELSWRIVERPALKLRDRILASSDPALLRPSEG